MRISQCLLCLLAPSLFLGSAAVHAQEPVVVPGSALIDASLIRPRLDSIRLIVRQKDGTEGLIRDLVRSVEASRHAGVPTWTIVQQYTSPARAITTDTSIIRRSDLGPVSYVARLESETQRFRFDGAVVQGTVVPTDSAPRRVDYQLAFPVFNAVVDIEVIRALPLDAGFSARLSTYNPPRPPAEQHTVISVSGSDTVTTRGSLVSAWIIHYDAGGAPTTLWIAKEGRDLLKLRSELRGGAVFWQLPAGRSLGSVSRDTLPEGVEWIVSHSRPMRTRSMLPFRRS